MTGALRGRPHPLLLEIPVRAWLARLGRDAGRPARFDEVPDAGLEAIRGLGFDGVWLMGVWPTGPRARRIALSHPDLLRSYQRALPGWEPADVGGSPYSIAAYEPLPGAGGREGLRNLRRRLHEHGLGLVLDLVPNHVGIDHPWLDERPDLLVGGTARDLVREPGNWFVHAGPGGRERVLAHGRDPHFPGWSDTAQVDHRRRDARAAMTEILRDLASLADGVRCDVAMLPLRDVFERTWGPGDPADAGDFWSEAIPAVRESRPDLVLMGEVYWGLGPRLLSLGFDWVYDKDLLDALTRTDLPALRRAASAPPGEHAGLVRFLENHDEPRAAAALAGRDRAAAVLAYGLPGVRFFLDGQVDGARTRVPVQLRRGPAEPPDESRRAFYETLLRFLDDDALHRGEWSPLEARGEDGSPAPGVFVSRWARGDATRLLVANLGETAARVRIAWAPGGAPPAVLRDVTTGEDFELRVQGESELAVAMEVAATGHRLLRSRT